MSSFVHGCLPKDLSFCSLKLDGLGNLFGSAVHRVNSMLFSVGEVPAWTVFTGVPSSSDANQLHPILIGLRIAIRSRSKRGKTDEYTYNRIIRKHISPEEALAVATVPAGVGVVGACHGGACIRVKH